MAFLIFIHFTLEVIGPDRTDHYNSLTEHFDELKLYHEQSRSSDSSITCPEIGNVTFTNQPPFDVLGIPQCGDDIKPHIV